MNKENAHNCNTIFKRTTGLSIFGEQQRILVRLMKQFHQSICRLMQPIIDSIDPTNLLASQNEIAQYNSKQLLEFTIQNNNIKPINIRCQGIIWIGVSFYYLNVTLYITIVLWLGSLEKMQKRRLEFDRHWHWRWRPRIYIGSTNLKKKIQSKIIIQRVTLRQQNPNPFDIELVPHPNILYLIEMEDKFYVNFIQNKVNPTELSNTDLEQLVSIIRKNQMIRMFREQGFENIRMRDISLIGRNLVSCILNESNLIMLIKVECTCLIVKLQIEGQDT
ncbi:unnamed protein product (macronuclear) [Paramecium tetraurelia]|uniref:Uncharacterized protein n=1 Tax=Paramecium tetraurelia TaxID=5888 RepID=A0BJW2_PARTE|nr:uncharacterized protein GSPATT00029459001 [Paramecium tetraurelia]CAK58829.1 unnamed protein product [Paramecium tetraurelia]|eukprot:XP_001426227.1 hypothetical protein (macronuclear) [Paramecium tetraurelia strain d4-2]